jgi:hypothetical protein
MSTCKVKSSYNSATIFSTIDSSFSVKWTRLYRGSENEFSAAAFHRFCDNKGPTVVLVRAKNGRVAAGYSCVPWKSGEGEVEKNPRGFVCSIDSNDLSIERFKGVLGECEIYQIAGWGPDFCGGVGDLPHVR